MILAGVLRRIILACAEFLPYARQMPPNQASAASRCPS
jgi:hypothetical protein